MSDIPPTRRIGLLANILNGLIGSQLFGKKVLVRPTEPCMKNEFRTSHGSRLFTNESGQAHRDDGPAILQFACHPKTEKYQWKHEWYRNGRLHRIDGPAVVWDDGYVEWFANGLRVQEDAVKDIKINADAPWFQSVVDEMIWLGIAEKTEPPTPRPNSFTGMGGGGGTITIYPGNATATP